jgi:hypothetical protein
MNDEDLGVSIFDAVSGKFIDTLRAVLYRLCPRSHVIELYDIFGKEHFIKFLDLFSGTTVEVPSRSTLEQGMQDVLIYLTLSRTEPAVRPKMTRHLAQRTGLTAGEVRSRFVATEKALKDLQLEAK